MKGNIPIISAFKRDGNTATIPRFKGSSGDDEIIKQKTNRISHYDTTFPRSARRPPFVFARYKSDLPPITGRTTSDVTFKQMATAPTTEQWNTATVSANFQNSERV